MISEEAWEQAASAVRSSEEVAICCHVGPDGDAFGSMLGLGSCLRRMGKKVWMSWGTAGLRVPPQYLFLPGIADVAEPDTIPDGIELFVAIDCGDRKRLEMLEDRFSSATNTLNIDHHISNDAFAKINLVDPRRASSAELAYELLVRMGAEINIDEALCLYTGLVTDTGRFQYSNTTPETLRTAAKLREYGFDHGQINTEVYESSSFENLRVLGLMLSRASLDDDLVWSWVGQADLAGLGLEETENFIDALRVVKDAEVAVVLKEQTNGEFKASLRSRGKVDVAAIASSFGGGGHARAAGFTVKGSVDEIIASIRERI
ncbi:MAG: bifunctional oligoribonuclease/PAP phosphatase NrnA [Actinomycetota bacterium]